MKKIGKESNGSELFTVIEPGLSFNQLSEMEESLILGGECGAEECFCGHFGCTPNTCDPLACGHFLCGLDNGECGLDFLPSESGSEIFFGSWSYGSSDSFSDDFEGSYSFGYSDGFGFNLP